MNIQLVAENDMMVEYFKNGSNSGPQSPTNFGLRINIPKAVYSKVKKEASNWAQSPMIENEVEVLEKNPEIVRLSLPEPIGKYCYE